MQKVKNFSLGKFLEKQKLKNIFRRFLYVSLVFTQAQKGLGCTQQLLWVL